MRSSEFGSNSFVVVANRLPVDLHTRADGSTEWVPSPGGLVSGLSPVLEKQQGCWVGWPGVADASPEPLRTDKDVLLHPVTLTARDYTEFYEGFSNATLWPLYHDLIVKPTYDHAWWETYRDVNQRFAEATASVAAEGATVWVQDYQLQLVPGLLREMRPDLRVGFFLHIPFPGADLFQQLPWREEILDGLLGADLLGFQLESGVQNFLEVASMLGRETAGEPATRAAAAQITTNSGRKVGVGAFPISIDTSPFEAADDDAHGERSAPATQLRAALGNPETVLLGVDRLDYTKGILQRLEAYEELLANGTLDPSSVTFIQLATPSRERIDSYKVTRSAVEEAVGRINGRFAELGRPVVHYQHRSVSKQTLRDYYRAADVMLVTPFKDGMNLVAKEFIACHGVRPGALVLSEFAGAACELEEAFLCNPFDKQSLRNQLARAVAETRDNPDAATARMRAMYEQVTTHDVDLWSRSFLSYFTGQHAAEQPVGERDDR